MLTDETMAIGTIRGFADIGMRFAPMLPLSTAVVRLLGDAVRATQVGDLPAGFAILDDHEDLARRSVQRIGLQPKGQDTRYAAHIRACARDPSLSRRR